MDESDLATLRTFNVQVDELYRTTVPQYAWAWYEKNDDFTLVVKGNEVSIENVYFPEENDLKSFLMTYKTLTENKYNHCSLGNIATIYEKLPDNLDEKTQFNKWRNEINSYLKEIDPNFKIQEKTGEYLSRGHVIDIYINGKYAHLGKEKTDIVNNWLSDPTGRSLFNYYFIRSLIVVADRLFQIKLVNESVLNNKSLFSN